MRVPTVRGVIDRRILVNYRVDPTVLERVLPPPFRPKRVGEWGIAGICLIRLKNIRPVFLPAVFGMSSENAAHRIAVEWERDGRVEEGVYITRRDTSSRFNTIVGGRLFPGVHHHARFDVHESEQRYCVRMDSDDRRTHVLVEGRAARQLPAGSVFATTEQASEFFEQGSIGYSNSYATGEFDGLKLDTFNWRASPLEVDRVESSFFDDPEQFPEGTIELDSALLMRGIEHQWCEQPMLCCEAAGG